MNGEVDRRSEFEGFSLDAERKILWRAGEIVPLPPKAVEMLVVLVKNRGEVVSKNELLEAVWGETFVEESVLSNNVYLLRKTLSELAGVKNLIQTVPRRGYRFGGKKEKSDAEFVLEHHVFERTLVEEISGAEATETRVETIVANESSLAPVAEPKSISQASLPAAGNPTHRPAKTYLFGAAIFALLLAAGFVVWQRNQSTAKNSSLTEIKSIAVLPLKPIAAAEADKVLSLGLADALITRLGASQKIIVRSVSSVAPFAETDLDALAAGRKLQADAVLDGSFQRSDNRLRVSARLLSVADGKQIWSGTFDETEADIFALQDSLAAQVAESLHWNLTAAERESLTKRPTENVQAYEKYLRGRYLWNQRTSNDLLKAIEEFESAVRLDANFALAYVGLADCYALLSVYDERPPLEAYPIAKEKAQVALKLNPNSAEARTTLAFIAYRFEWKREAAEREFRRAIELNPNYSTAHHWFGEFLMASGRFDEAVAEYRKALAIDPTSLIVNTDLGYGLFLARRFDESVAQLQATTNLNPNFPLAFYCLADSLAAQKRERESVEVFIKWLTLIETDAAAIAKMQRAFGDNDFAEFKRARLEWIEAEAQKNNFTKVDVARFYAEAANKNSALDWLENALRERAADLVFVAAHPGFDALRDEPRFQEILRQINLR